MALAEARNKVAVIDMRLIQMNLLAGTVEVITMTGLRQRPGDVIDQVQLGKIFTITKAGKVVAILAKPEPTAFELGAEIRRLRLC
jgi:prevent-host-death family protein